LIGNIPTSAYVKKKPLKIIRGEMLKTEQKSLDRYPKFTFITGVSKFTHVSLFSGPNNLTDITMDPMYAGMMGYTEEELKANLKGYIHDIAKKRTQQGDLSTEEAVIEEMRSRYNGYRFSGHIVSLSLCRYSFNSFSIRLHSFRLECVNLQIKRLLAC